MPADSLLQKLIHLDKLLRDRECGAAVRDEIIQAQQEVLAMQQEMLRLLEENQRLREDLAHKPPVAAKLRSRLFTAKAS